VLHGRFGAWWRHSQKRTEGRVSGGRRRGFDSADRALIGTPGTIAKVLSRFCGRYGRCLVEGLIDLERRKSARKFETVPAGTWLSEGFVKPSDKKKRRQGKSRGMLPMPKYGKRWSRYPLFLDEINPERRR